MYFTLTILGSQVSNLQIEFKQILIKLSDERNLKEIIYKHFLESIQCSITNDLENQTPIFVTKIMAQKSGIDLFNLLQSETPYCDLFNFLDFFEQIIKKLDKNIENIEKIKKVISRSKEILVCTKKDEIKPYVKKEYSEKEDFTPVVLQMYENLEVYTGGAIQYYKKLTSFILNLDNLVCFVGYDEELQTVTFLIPSILTERAYNSASQSADRFSTNSILFITIGRYKVFNRICESIPKNQSVNKASTFVMQFSVNNYIVTYIVTLIRTV